MMFLLVELGLGCLEVMLMLVWVTGLMRFYPLAPYLGLLLMMSRM